MELQLSKDKDPEQSPFVVSFFKTSNATAIVTTIIMSVNGQIITTNYTTWQMSEID